MCLEMFPRLAELRSVELVEISATAAATAHIVRFSRAFAAAHARLDSEDYLLLADVWLLPLDGSFFSDRDWSKDFHVFEPSCERPEHGSFLVQMTRSIPMANAEGSLVNLKATRRQAWVSFDLSADGATRLLYSSMGATLLKADGATLPFDGATLLKADGGYSTLRWGYSIEG